MLLWRFLAAEAARQLKGATVSSAHDKYEMRFNEFSAPKAPKKPQRIKPLKTIKPSKKSIPNIKPETPAQAMIAAKKRQIEVSKMALKREQEFQRRHRELEKQRKARNLSSR